MSKKNYEDLSNSETFTEQHGEKISAAESTMASLSSLPSSSTEFIQMEELTEELNAIIESDNAHRDDAGLAPTDSISKPLTVGERLMSIAVSAARFFNVPRLILGPILPASMTNSLDKILPFVKIGHVSARGIEYVKIANNSKLGVFQSSVRQLEKYSAEFVQNRHEVIVHTFPPPIISSTDTDEQLISYYVALLFTIEQTIKAVSRVSIGTALESLSVTAGSSETVNEHIFDATAPISDQFAGNLVSQVIETIGSAALRRYKFILVRLRFTNVSNAKQFCSAFNGPALKAVFILSARLPYCHFASTTPERRLRAAMLAQCTLLNDVASRFAASHGFDEPTRVKHVTNGTYIFKKIESPYGSVGNVKIPIDANSSLGQMRSSIFTLVKYAQIYLTKRANLLIRNVPESIDLSEINALLRLALANNDTETVSEIVAIERIGRQPRPAGQHSRLVRVVLRDDHKAEAMRTAFNRKVHAAKETRDEFYALKNAGAFIHGDLSPPELAFQRRLGEFCRAQNASRESSASDSKRYRYFYRDTTLMRVPHDEK